MSLLHSYEDVFDLTETKKIALPIREDSNGELKVDRLTSTKMSNVKEALHVLNKGLKNRTTASTLVNHASLCSQHCFVTLLKNIISASLKSFNFNLFLFVHEH